MGWGPLGKLSRSGSGSDDQGKTSAKQQQFTCIDDHYIVNRGWLARFWEQFRCGGREVADGTEGVQRKPRRCLRCVGDANANLFWCPRSALSYKNGVVSWRNLRATLLRILSPLVSSRWLGFPFGIGAAVGDLHRGIGDSWFARTVLSRPNLVYIQQTRNGL